jgi:hypothetical protein
LGDSGGLKKLRGKRLKDQILRAGSFQISVRSHSRQQRSAVAVEMHLTGREVFVLIRGARSPAIHGIG